ncbi:NMT1/THI5 like domain protein [Desulfamplus magnetovallimortis]|uniref:NMT1/THI5 like domain protein n=1 Tax=Desulfamplus magnetovallimortis TaxID=1246637 RepID=A0A1W1HJ79_9BACT|nr:ABC transporter substrate-binding protein [Desulfamplus magnetovallimortis]SLM32514.1 NMT1/THI5 like domain protein [Desulfamplus magnetovallimortis]
MDKKQINHIIFMGFCIVTALAGVSLLQIACSSPEKLPIRIGVNSWPPCELWYIADEQGFFGDTKVELVRFSSWRDNMLSFYKGHLDITHASYFNALYYSDKGEKGKIILRTETIEGGDGLIIKKSIKDIKTLYNKSIAVETGTDEHFLLHKSLELLDISTEDITIVSVPTAEASIKFINNEVEGSFLYEPFMSEAAAKGDGRIVSTTKEYPGYMIDVLVAGNKSIEKRRKDLQNIIEAWYRAMEYVDKNPEKAFTRMAQNENMTMEEFGKFYSYFTFYSINENREYMKSDTFFSKLNEINSFLLSKKFLKDAVDVHTLVDTTIIDAVY